MEPRITLIGRQGCHLCDVARATVTMVADETGCGLVELDFDTDPGLPSEYADLLPVILIDSRVHDTWRVDEDRLRAALRKPVRPGDKGANGKAPWWRRFTGGGD